MFWRWVSVVILVALCLWSANQTLACWWAGGGPPTPNADYYRHCGNIYFGLTCGLVVLAGALSVSNIRRVRKKGGS